MSIKYKGRTMSGPAGADGKDAYQLYAESGGTLTKEQWLASLAQGAPGYAESAAWLKEHGEQGKLYVLPDGHIWAWAEVDETAGGINQISLSIDSDGSSYNGGVGYRIGYRLNSSGAETAVDNAVVSGFIPFLGGDVELKIPTSSLPHGYNYLHVYDSSFAAIRKTADGTVVDGSFRMLRYWVENYGAAYTNEGDAIKISIPAASLAISGAKYIRVSAFISTALTDQTFDLSFTGDSGSENAPGYRWTNTGLSYAPSDNEARIVALENKTGQLSADLDAYIASGGGDVLPAYWLEYLPERADMIRTAMEAAGPDRSAFLWYTDAHWANGSAKRSPELLRYLWKNTPMNKINFGGDIVGDSLLGTRDQMDYLYEWRRRLKGIPNHHSVIGNHDDFDNDTYGDDNFTYAFLLAPEESYDMVKGGTFYYYIDNPCEKTRYLYLDSGKYRLSDDEAEFIIGALNSAPDLWHIVVISHIWFQYSSVSDPEVGNMNSYVKKALDLFDACNARASGSVTMAGRTIAYDFSGSGGRVEFCIGGHIHTDCDLASDGGIPVIMTSPDSNQPRGGEPYKLGTTAEACVYGIVADYGAGKVRVINVGRGLSRDIALPER